MGIVVSLINYRSYNKSITQTMQTEGEPAKILQKANSPCSTVCICSQLVPKSPLISADCAAALLGEEVITLQASCLVVSGR